MDKDSFKQYKTTEEYKALSPKSKSKLRDKQRYMEQKKDPEFQARKKEQNEREKLQREEATKSLDKLKHRHWMKNFLLKNPQHELGKRCFNLVLTGEIDHSIRGKMSKSDVEYLKTFVLPDIPEPKRREEKKKYHEEHHEERLASAKSYREKKKEEENEELINWKFRIHDGNAVLTTAEIQMKPLCYLDKFSQKEKSKYEKFHLLKTESEKDEFLKKCEEERNSYLKEVESISLSEKKQFLKDKKVL